MADRNKGARGDGQNNRTVESVKSEDHLCSFINIRAHSVGMADKKIRGMPEDGELGPAE